MYGKKYVSEVRKYSVIVIRIHPLYAVTNNSVLYTNNTYND